MWNNFQKICQGQLRTSDQIRQPMGISQGSGTDGREIIIHDIGAHLPGGTPGRELLYLPLLFTKGPVSLFGSQSQTIGTLGESEIRIVLTEQDAVLSPGCEHPVGLIDALVHQVVDENADIGDAARKDPFRRTSAQR